MSAVMPKEILLSDIDASDRLRPVSEAYAQALAVSIGARGLFNRIAIRQTPNGARKWRLVLGAHRLRAMEIAGIEAMTENAHFVVVKADADEARIMEAEENLARNDLTKLERALSIAAYRDAWKRRHKTIHGGDRRSEQFQPAKLGGLKSDFTSLGDHLAGFSTWAAERLGLSARSIERFGFIATKLDSALAAQLFPLPYADNQHLLEALAGLERSKQIAIAEWIAAGKDPEAIIHEALNGKVKEATATAAKAYSAVIGNWGRMPVADKWRALDHIGVSAILTDEQRDTLAFKFGES